MSDEEYAEPDYTLVLGKAPTALQRRMAEWIRSGEVGYDPNTAKSKLEAFNEGVRIAVAHRMTYQASAHNREATAVEKAERAQSREAAAAQREADREARAAARAATPAEAPVETPAVAKPKKAPAKKAPAAPPAAAPATTRPAPRRAPARRAPAASSAAGSGEAPF
jgi:hypothetical protein